MANGLAGKVENEFAILAKKFPDRAGVEDWRTGRGFQLIAPLDSDFHIRTVMGHAEALKLRT